MKTLLAFVLVCTSALASAVPNKKVRCGMDWDGAQLTFDFKFNRPTRSVVVLTVAGTDQMELPSQAAQVGTNRHVAVVVFMGMLEFVFPAAIFNLANLGVEMNVTVKADIEGDESSATVKCQAVR